MQPANGSCYHSLTDIMLLSQLNLPSLKGSLVEYKVTRWVSVVVQQCQLLCNSGQVSTQPLRCNALR